jgi:hypothetical protein
MKEQIKSKHKTKLYNIWNNNTRNNGTKYNCQGNKASVEQINLNTEQNYIICGTTIPGIVEQNIIAKGTRLA